MKFLTALFLVGSAALLAACQQRFDLPSAPILVEPSDRDRALFGQFLSTVTARYPDAPTTMKPVFVESSALSLNLVRVATKIGGKPLQPSKYAPLEAGNITYYRSIAATDDFISELKGFVLTPGGLIETIVPQPLDAELKPIQMSGQPTLGTLTKQSGDIVNYALYDLSVGRACVTFIENRKTAVFKGFFCTPPGQALGKTRAEAFIRSVGLEPAVPIEASADITALPAN